MHQSKSSLQLVTNWQSSPLDQNQNLNQSKLTNGNDNGNGNGGSYTNGIDINMTDPDSISVIKKIQLNSQIRYIILSIVLLLIISGLIIGILIGTNHISIDNNNHPNNSLAGSNFGGIILISSSSGSSSSSTGVASNIVDTIPPTVLITAPNPNQIFPSGTKQIIFTATTNEEAICKWSITDQTYNSMVNPFITTGLTSHTTTITGLLNGQIYIRYVRCRDRSNNTSLMSSTRTFSIAASTQSILIEPIYNPATDALILRDDFNQYVDRTALLQRYPIGRNTNLVSLIADGSGAGNGKAVRLSYPAGDKDILFGTESRMNSIGSWNGTLPQVAGPYNHFLFTSSFRTNIGAAFDEGAGGIKGFMFWHDTESSGNRRSEFGVSGNYKCNRDNPGWTYAETRGIAQAYDNACTGLNIYKTPDGGQPIWSNYNDGGWHTITFEIFTADSGHVGARVWMWMVY